MSQKLRISKPGYNVLTETDVDNIIFDSQYDTLKYYVTGSVDLVVSGADAETTITHGLGYVPFFIVFVNKFSGASATRFNMVPGTFNSVGYTYAQAFADNDKIYFKVFTNAATTTYNFKYKIFRNNTGL